MSIIDEIKKQVAWRGPNGRVLGHVVITRDDAMTLLCDISLAEAAYTAALARADALQARLLARDPRALATHGE